MTSKITEAFWLEAGLIINSGQSRSLLLTGNIMDLFPAEDQSGSKQYFPLVDFLVRKWSASQRLVIVYELNGPIRFVREGDQEKVKTAWTRLKTGGRDESDQVLRELVKPSEKAVSRFDAVLQEAIGKPTMALELLRQFCLCSRSILGDRPLLEENLLIIVEGADMLIPAGEISRLSDVDRHRIGICQDWFSDLGFMRGGDSVVLISESRSSLNQRVAALPSMISVAIPFPSLEYRREFIDWFIHHDASGGDLKFWASVDDLASATAGLTLHALRQLLVGASYAKQLIRPEDVTAKVEEHIQAQLGEEVVEFKKPTHRLKDLIGFSHLKKFLLAELIPRLRSTGADALPGAAVCGPIGGGKSYILEAVAAELGIPVLVLKSIRSKWYGETDVIWERLERVLEALSRVLIFVDEADTQFGSVGADAHETERRLTGKIQAMMSDPKLLGKVSWLLMTARIHLLSPDIRRPGRVGDLIIPILDPEGKDWEDFVRWTVQPALGDTLESAIFEQLKAEMTGWSAAVFASLRGELKAKAKVSPDKLDPHAVLAIIHDRIPPAIDQARRYQKLQALVNCTRRSLLPPLAADKDLAAQRQDWESQIRQLELQGVR